MHHTSEFGCGYHNHHSYHGHHSHERAMHHHGGGCCALSHGHRRFYTKEEVINHLEEYLKQLQAEAKGVEEHINTLKQADAER